MADNPMLGSRVRESDKRKFKQMAKSHGKTDAEMFGQLLRVWDTRDVGSLEMPQELINVQQTLRQLGNLVRQIYTQAAANQQRLEMEKNSIHAVY